MKAQRNLIDLATYVALFPQLIAGPIVRYSDIAEQLKGRIHTMGKTAQGIRRFILGPVSYTHLPPQRCKI